MLKILIAGSFRTIDGEPGDCGDFAEALGAASIAAGHVLLSGCKSDFDERVAAGAAAELARRELADVAPPRIVSYILRGAKPAHQHGKVRLSKLTDWGITGRSLYIPEQVQLADVVVLVGGSESTSRTANWARIADKPLLPLTNFGGAAAEIYRKELRRFDNYYAHRVARHEYERLNEVVSDWPVLARDVIELAREVVTSSIVFVVMSYSDRPDLRQLFQAFKEVCGERGFDCRRIDESNSLQRIVPEMLHNLRGAAFVIADLTESKPNVFFEVGFAEGARKTVILTAKAGTELPFDVKDVPTIYWDDLAALRQRLGRRLDAISEERGRAWEFRTVQGG